MADLLWGQGEEEADPTPRPEV